MTQDRAARRRARRTGQAARVAGLRRRPRPALLASTALQATTVLLLAFPAAAQPAPGARPIGGTVVGGAASISQSTAQTTVAQSSQRAAIDWRSYDIGSGHTVQYLQPNASAIVLNRVTGPDPSQIAGRIQANGQVVITNPSGVVFYQGSQVNAQTLIVSAAGISTQNFMAGKMLFDRPGHADARISNAGEISVAGTGLAALVAPQVANSGVIRAKMGHVVLAGAEAHTVDLYGDGLMSVDVTKEVRHAPGGGTALVTNTGTIMADGGTIVLTAKAADGIVQNLVSAGGRLQADTAAGHAGSIVVSAVGGTISIEGAIHADGRAPGAAGGTVTLAATDTVAVKAGARVSASGQGGGGTVAVGTTLARARAQGGGVPDGSARSVDVAAGARIAADGRGTGSGGVVAILATDRTGMAGRITAKGGKQGGNGGNVEVSGRANYSLTGTISTAAPHGTPGNILLDPDNVTIVPGAAGSASDDGSTGTGTVPAGQGTGSSYTISDGTLSGFAGNVTVQATGNVTINAGVTINLTSGLAQPTPVLQNLVLQAGNNLTVNATSSITASGNVVLTASTAGITGATTTGTLSVGGSVASTAGNVFLASNGTAAGASVFVNGNVSAASAGGVVSISGNTAGVGPGATVTAGQRIDLATTNGAALTIGNTTVIDPTATLAAPRVRIGQASLSDGVTTPADGAATTAITFALPFSTAGTLELRTTGSVIQASTAPVGAGQLVGSASGSITLNNPGNAIGALGTATTGLTSGTGNSAVTTTGALDIAGAVDVGSANKLTLNASAITETAGTINAGSVDTTSTAGSTTLDKANTFTNIAAASAAGNATFDVTGALNLAGPVNVGANTLSLSSVLGLTQSVAGTITAGTLTGTVGDANAAVTTGRDAVLNGIGNAIGNLSDFTVKQGNLALADTQPLTQLAGHTVTARNVTLSTTDLVLNGNVGACAIDPVTAGLVTLNATGHVTIAGVVGGENKTVVNGATGTTVVAGFLEAGNPASTAAALQINNGLTLTGGAVAANVVGIGGNVTQSGGTLVLTGGLAGTYSFTGGSVYSPVALSIVSTGFAAGSVISAPSVSVTEPSATPLFTTGADVFAPGNIGFTLQGGFSQTGGQIVSGGSLQIGGGGGVPASGTITQSGGTLAGQAGVTLYSVGSGAVSLNGTLAGPAVQVIEPFAAVSFGPTALAGGFTQTAPAAAVTLHCPSCDGLSPSIGVTAGGLLAGPAAAAVRVDSSSLNLTSNFTAGTLELHSTGATTQTAPFTAATLTGTAGYAVTIHPFALPTWNTPAGAGGVGLIAPNGIATLGPYYAGGSLSVTSNSAMTVVDKVVAGPNQTATLQAPALTVDGVGASGFVALGTVTNGAFSTALRPANAGTFALPAAPATATTFGTVQLGTDHLTLSGAASVVNAAGGVVAIAPFTAGAAVSVDGAPSAGTWVVAPQLALVNTLGNASGIGFAGPQTLRLGSLDGTLPGAPSSLTLNAPLNLVNVAGTLGLYANGTIDETALGGLTIGRAAAGPAPKITGTLTGQAAGAVTLTGGNGTLTFGTAGAVVPTNHFDVLAGFAANGLSVADGTVAGAALGGLAVTGTVSSGSGDLGLLSVGALVGGVRQGGTLALGTASAAATVTAANQTATLVARDGVSTAAAITETATSSIGAGMLAARASTADTTATAYDVVLSNASNAVGALGNVSVGATLPSGLLSAQGGFTLRTGGPALAVTGLVTAKSVTITANAMTVSGGIGACAVGAAGGTVTLNNAGALAIGGSVGGQAGVVLTSAGLTTVSGLLNGPAVGVTTGGLLVAGGQVFGGTVTVAGGTTVSGGSLRAQTLNAGTVAVQGAGDVYADNSLAVTAATPTLDGTIASGGNLTVTSTGALTLGSTPASPATLAAGGSLLISTAGDFTQTAGTVAATTAVSIITSGGVTQAASGTIEAGSGAAGSGTVTLLGTGPASTASLQGVLSAGTIQVSEPNVALTFAPPSLLGSATVAVGPLQPITLHCPGCDANVAAATYPLAATPGTGRPAALRVDGNSLVLGTIAADTIELHSAGDTTQTATGTVTAGRLLGTAGYGFTAAATALPTWNAPATAGSLVLGNAGNSVAKLGPSYAGGSVTVTTGGTLTVVDLVAAGGAATPASTAASTIALTAPAITVDGAATRGALRFGLVSGGVFGSGARPVGASPAPAASALAATDTLFNQVSLQTDRLNILGASPRVEALDGRVAIAPLTAGLAMSVDAAQTGAGSLVSSQLGLISTIGGATGVGNGGRQSLLLGSLDGTLTNAAGSLTLNAALPLTNSAATLGLYATGDIVENTATGISIGRQAGGGKPAVTGTLTGQAGGEVRLVGQLAGGGFGPLTLANALGVTPANHFDVLGGFAAGTALAIADTPDANSGQTGLVVHGTVSSGAGDLGLLSVGTVQGAGRVGGTIAIGDAGTGAALDAGAQTLTLVARDGKAGQAAITLNGPGAAGSTITAATLQGRAQTVDTSATRYDVSLLEGATTNTVGTLGDFTVGTGPTTGIVAAQGAFTLQAHGPQPGAPLLVGGTVTADTVTITANAITVGITGAIGACIVPAIASGNVVLTADGAAPTVTVAGGTVGAQSQVAIQAAQGAVVTAGTVDAPTVTIAGGLTQSGGQVFGNTVAIAGGATVTGGQLHATHLVTAFGGSSPVPISFGGGDIYAGNDLAVTAIGGALTGALTAGNTLGVNAAGSLVSSATLVAGSVLNIETGGDFLQSAGLIASRTAVGITAGGQVGQSGGTIEAGSGTGSGSILLSGTGASGGVAGLAGTLSATQVRVIEPGYAVQFAPASLVGGATVTAGGLSLVLHCPGCDLAAPASTVSNSAVAGPYRPAALRLDGGTLTIGAAAADTIELHSAGDTTASGALTGLVLTGSAGYAPGGLDVNGLPTYTLGPVPAAGQATFGNTGNDVFALSGYQARLGLVLADTPAPQRDATGVMQQAAGLTLAGVVRAGQASDPLDATTAAASGGPVTITTLGANGQIGLVGTLAGSAVQLVASGAITQSGGGAVVANQLTGSATTATFGTATSGATAQQGNQVAMLDHFQTTSGDLALNDSRNLVATNDTAAGALTLSAQAGTLTPSAAEGQAAGSLAFGNLQAGGAVTLTAAAGLSGTGVATPSTLSVAAGQGVMVSGASARTVTGSAGQDVSVAGGFDQAGPINAPGAVALSDTRGLTVQNGVAAGGALRVTTDGTLAITGAVSGQSVSLASGAATTISGVVQAAGALTATAGPGTTLVTGTLTGGTQVGITAAVLDVEGAVSAPALQVSTGSGLTVGPGGTLAGGTITSVSGGAAALSGTVTASGAASVTADGISVGGRVRAATIGLDAGGSTLSSTGSLDAAGTMALRTAGDVVLAAGSTSNAGASLALSGQGSAPARSATLGGTVATPLLTVIADGIALPGGALNLGGVVQPSGVKAAALPAAGSGAPGGYFEATSSLVQSAVASIRPLAGYANATVRIDLTGGAGQIVLGNLFAPAGNLILDVGAGSATGQITVRNLFALYTATGPGAGGIRLSGTVAGQSGTGAAGLSAVSPAPNPHYEINSCALASVNCVVLRPQALPIGNPLKELSLGFFREQEDDGALLVPNITEQGL